MVTRKLIGEILVEQKRVSETQLAEALKEAQATGRKIGEVLVAKRIINLDDLGRAFAERFEVPYASLTDEKPGPEALTKIPPSFAKQNQVLPLRLTDTTFSIAMANPDDLESLDWLQARTGRAVETCFALPERIDRLIAFYYGVGAHTTEIEEVDSEDTITLDDYSVESMRRASQEAPTIQLVNDIIAECAQMGSSDIHFEPQRTSLDVRVRIDGTLRKIRSLPNTLKPAVTSRLKLMADIDIAERRIPQDGRISVMMNGRLDIRVNSLPTQWGERLVLRLLDKSAGLRSLKELGMNPVNECRFREALGHPHGMILVTGPTGSGKSTTLYAALKELNAEAVNILTCEDPIEYEMAGISQSQVHERIGLTFLSQLRAAMRQDPDIILVGEIRDLETAEVAARAAMTGHLVLSTLHTNDAPSAIPRLIDMEVEPFLINSSLITVTAQRLVRKLCPSCSEEGVISEHEAEALSIPPGTAIRRSTGCPSCSESGYRGRVGVHEVMTMNEEIQQLCLRRAASTDIKAAALREGMMQLVVDLASKVTGGRTSPDEALRFIGGARKEITDLDEQAA